MKEVINFCERAYMYNGIEVQCIMLNKNTPNTVRSSL